MDFSSQCHRERISTLDWGVISVSSSMGRAVRVLSLVIRSVIFSSLTVKVVFISRMVDSSLVSICWRRFSIERGRRGGFPVGGIAGGVGIGVGVLGEGVDGRVLDRARRLRVVFEIIGACVFLLIDMTLQDEDLKSYECDEDVEDRKWVRKTRERKFETNDGNVKE